MPHESEPAAPAKQMPTMPRISIFKLLEAPAKSRLETLSDGIFAVAMTLLILDLKVPTLPPSATSLQLFYALFELWPRIGAFTISFFFLAKTWDVHRLVIHSLERVDYVFSVENVLLLLFACGLPFSTSLVAEYPHLTVAAVIYLANMIALPTLNYAMWHHATSGYRLVSRDMNPSVIEWFSRNHRLVIAVYSIGFPIAYFSSELSVLWILVFQIVMHLLPFVSRNLSGNIQ